MHPTCKTLSLTITSKFVAFFDLVFGLFGLVWFVLMLSRYDIISLDPFENIAASNETATSRLSQMAFGVVEDKQEFAVSHKVINLSLVAFYTVVNLSLSTLLTVGIYNKSTLICLVWFHIRCAIFVFKLIILVIYLIEGRPLYSQVPFLFSMVVHLYGLWVVNSFVEEMKMERFQLQVQETREKNEEMAKVNSIAKTDIFDVPNGIESLQRQRLQELYSGE